MKGKGISCRLFQIMLVEPWMEQPYIGLTGFELYGKDLLFFFNRVYAN